MGRDQRKGKGNGKHVVRARGSVVAGKEAGPTTSHCPLVMRPAYGKVTDREVIVIRSIVSIGFVDLAHLVWCSTPKMAHM